MGLVEGEDVACKCLGLEALWAWEPEVLPWGSQVGSGRKNPKVLYWGSFRRSNIKFRRLGKKPEQVYVLKQNRLAKKSAEKTHSL